MIGDTDETRVTARVTRESWISVVGQDAEESRKDEREREVETNIGGILLGTKGSLSLPNSVTGKAKGHLTFPRPALFSNSLQDNNE